MLFYSLGTCEETVEQDEIFQSCENELEKIYRYFLLQILDWTSNKCTKGKWLTMFKSSLGTVNVLVFLE